MRESHLIVCLWLVGLKNTLSVMQFAITVVNIMHSSFTLLLDNLLNEKWKRKEQFKKFETRGSQSKSLNANMF